MKNQPYEYKNFSMRMPKDIWTFLRNTAFKQDETMSDIIVRCVDKYRKKLENKLTNNDVML